jgi:hypothetical protein
MIDALFKPFISIQEAYGCKAKITNKIKLLDSQTKQLQDKKALHIDSFWFGVASTLALNITFPPFSNSSQPHGKKSLP